VETSPTPSSSAERFGIRLRSPPQQLHLQHEWVQDVLEVVGDAGGHLAERAQLVKLLEVSGGMRLAIELRMAGGHSCAMLARRSTIPPHAQAFADRAHTLSTLLDRLGLSWDEIEPFGWFAAKLQIAALDAISSRPRGRAEARRGLGRTRHWARLKGIAMPNAQRVGNIVQGAAS
jgi:hypothetical protein